MIKRIVFEKADEKAESKTFIDHKEAIEYYLKSKGRSAKYRKLAVTTLKTMMGKYKITEPTQVQLDDLMVQLDDKKKTSGTKYMYWYMLKTWAAAIGYPKINKPPFKVDVNEPDVPDMAEVDAIIKAAELKRNQAVLGCMAYAGLRSGECRGVYEEDIDLDADVIHLKSRPEKGYPLKDHQGRDLPIPPELHRLLAKWRDEARRVRLDKGVSVPNFFFMDNGLPLNERGVVAIMERAVKRAGVRESITAHKLRHFYAATLIKNGVDIITVCDLLGHSTPTVTQRYAHVKDMEHKKQAISKVKFSGGLTKHGIVKYNEGA